MRSMESFVNSSGMDNILAKTTTVHSLKKSDHEKQPLRAIFHRNRDHW